MGMLPLNNSAGQYKRIHNTAGEVNREKEVFKAVLDMKQTLLKARQTFKDDEEMLAAISNILGIKAELVKDNKEDNKE